MAISMFELSRQGTGHLREGIPCQDKTLALSSNGINCIALADGAGSARLSHVGAQVTIETVGNALCKSFDAFFHLTMSIR